MTQPRDQQAEVLSFFLKTSQTSIHDRACCLSKCEMSAVLGILNAQWQIGKPWKEMLMVAHAHHASAIGFESVWPNKGQRYCQGIVN
jgi:hypothetical protein